MYLFSPKKELKTQEALKWRGKENLTRKGLRGMREDINYYREQAAFWHKRTTDTVNFNTQLQKENRQLKKENIELKAMKKLVDLLKTILAEE